MLKLTIGSLYMSITIEELKKLAAASSLSFTEAELKELQTDFAKKQVFIQEVQAIKITNQQLQQVQDAKTDLRADVPHQSLPIDLVIKNSKDSHGGAFTVPSFME